MVEVFKTNVKEYPDAQKILAQIHAGFVGYKASFDLEDCDKILRIVSYDGTVQNEAIMRLIKKIGFKASVLPDEVPIAKTL
jgi:uncharacterized radical SAM superfamily protein